MQNFAVLKPTKFKIMLKQNIQKFYIQNWTDCISKLSSGKLSCYSNLKTCYGLEGYLLCNLSFSQRKSLTRLRTSSHRLNIELGRYKNIPRSGRICLRCDSGEIDDEIHFLFKCNTYNTQRNHLFETIEKSCGNFTGLNLENKLLWLLSCENEEILGKLCDFIIQSGI